MNSQNFAVESDDRKLFTSTTDVFMNIDSGKLRQAQQAEFGPYYEYLSDPNNRRQANQERFCRTIVKTGAFYIGLVSPVIFVKEVCSAINL